MGGINRDLIAVGDLRLELRYPRGHDVLDLSEGYLRGTDRDQPEVTLAGVPIVTNDVRDRDQLARAGQYRDVVDRGDDPSARLLPGPRSVP